MLTPRVFSYLRFSTPEQEKGDSRRRQIQAAENWAKDQGLEIDKTLNFEDRGVSAFKGDQRKKGALKRFLGLIEDGKIPRGSTLIVESLDRLSREQPLNALSLFQEIINSGIRVVTLFDKMEYSQESINNNIGQLFVSIATMARAYDESVTKSRRVKEAWKNKRAKINEKKLTARCPEWLILNKDKTAFEKLDDRCQTIRDIFRMKIAGKGSELIARELNKTKDIWKPKNGWRKSYINKILRNPAVIGEFQPFEKLPDGIRRPIGEPIPDYFPVVVSKKAFYLVQDQIKRNPHRGGRNGKVRNLFGHIAKCGNCGAPMHYVDKGKHWQYLKCDNARRGRKCNYPQIPYKNLEASILRYAADLNVDEILSDDEQKSALHHVQDDFKAKQAELDSHNQKIENLADSIATTTQKNTRRYLEEKLSNLLKERDDFSQDLDRLKFQLENQSNALRDFSKCIHSINELFSHMRSIDDQDTLVALRFKLRNHVRRIIDKIYVFPSGSEIRTEEFSRMKKYMLTKLKHKLSARVEAERAYLQIHFRAGKVEILGIDTEKKQVLYRIGILKNSTIPRVYPG